MGCYTWHVPGVVEHLQIRPLLRREWPLFVAQPQANNLDRVAPAPGPGRDLRGMSGRPKCAFLLRFPLRGSSTPYRKSKNFNNFRHLTRNRKNSSKLIELPLHRQTQRREIDAVVKQLQRFHHRRRVKLLAVGLPGDSLEQCGDHLLFL